MDRKTLRSHLGWDRDRLWLLHLFDRFQEKDVETVRKPRIQPEIKRDATSKIYRCLKQVYYDV